MFTPKQPLFRFLYLLFASIFLGACSSGQSGGSGNGDSLAERWASAAPLVRGREVPPTSKFAIPLRAGQTLRYKNIQIYGVIPKQQMLIIGMYWPQGSFAGICGMSGNFRYKFIMDTRGKKSLLGVAEVGPARFDRSEEGRGPEAICNRQSRAGGGSRVFGPEFDMLPMRDGKVGPYRMVLLGVKVKHLPDPDKVGLVGAPLVICSGDSGHCDSQDVLEGMRRTDTANVNLEASVQR